MKISTIYSGSRAQNNKTIGNLPEGSVAKILVVDEKKITIEVMLNGYLQRLYLEREKFEMDFTPMIDLFSPDEKGEATHEDVTEKKPHSQHYFYTATL